MRASLRLFLASERGPGPRPGSLVALALLLVTVAGCGLLPEVPRPARIVLVCADGVRGDVLADRAAAPPVLAALAEEGVVFRRCYTASTATIPAHVSILTGLDVLAHGVVDGTREPPVEEVTLASRLRDEGFRTQAFAALGEQGVRRGFDGFEVVAEAPGAGVLERALAWVTDQGDEPYFLFLQTSQVVSGAPPAEGEDPEALRAAYAERVASFDAALGALSARLVELGQWEDTLLIVTSGHGLALGEHGTFGHEGIAFEEVLRVPLVVSFPRLLPPQAPEEVNEIVWHLDVFATVVSIVDRELPPEGGRIDLKDVLRARRNVGLRRTVFPCLRPEEAASPDRRVVIQRNFKWLVREPSTGGRREEVVYDLEADPGEQAPRNAAGSGGIEPETLELLREELAAHLEHVGSRR